MNKDLIYLAQTDTTAGFLSQNLNKLNLLKGRDEKQPCLIAVAKFSVLRSFVRVPSKFKNMVRKSRQTSFLYPKKLALRVVKDSSHSHFLESMVWAYSTSANMHGHKFDKEWAKSVADVVVDNELKELKSSSIYRIGRVKVKRVR